MNRKYPHIRKLQTASLASAMADMAFLLLIFFMASTSTEPPKGVEVNLPQAETEGVDQDSLYVSIDTSGALYFEGEAVSMEQFRDGLAMRRGELDRPVALSADKDIDFSVVSLVLDTLSENDFLNVVFMSQPRQGDDSR